MSFSTDLAAMVANQLERFVTLRPHQLAGQVANLDFWLLQVRHAVETLEGYGVRYVRMEGTQQGYAAQHGVSVTTLNYDGDPVSEPPHPPRRIPDRELQKARRELLAAAERFLNRCRDEGLLSDAEFVRACQNVGVE